MADSALIGRYVDRSAPVSSGRSIPAESIVVVLPVYNEETTIASTIEEISQKVVQKFPGIRVILFEDGSQDGTRPVVDGLTSRYPWLSMRAEESRKGYARAAREAICSTETEAFEFILFLDSDGQYDPDDVGRLIEVARSHDVDIVMGARKNRAEPPYRRFLSFGLRAIMRILFDPPCMDVTSAFRLMKADVARAVAGQAKRSRFNFWLEFTAVAALEHRSVIEVPVSYRERAGESRVYSIERMPKIVANEFSALARLRVPQTRAPQ